MRTSTAYATLTPVAGGLAFVTPYDQGLLAEFKRRIPPDARKWEPSAKHWIVAPQYGQVCADLADTYLGVSLLVPQVVGKPTTETRILKIEYLGATKDRGGSEQTAFGYCDGGWNAVFPESVLRAWFECDVDLPETPKRPDATKTLYGQLGIAQTVTDQEVRSAYRRLARQWHPDVCHESGAADVFKRIQTAYEILAEPTKRKKYDAGLRLAAAVPAPRLPDRTREFSYTMDGGYRPLLRCGYLMCEGTETIGRLVVSKITMWEDILDDQGRTMISSWPAGADHHEIAWQ